VSGRERHPGDRLAALVDGRLGEPDRSRVIAHVASCPECLADYDAQLALKGLLGGLRTPGAPADLAERLAALPATAPPEPPRRLRSRGARWGMGAAAGVVSVLALGGLGYVAGGAGSGTAVVPPADDYLREHAAVSVSVPFAQPVLDQLVPQQAPLVTRPTVAPVQRTVPPVVGR
jgi:anti-sigma factor RsiW